MWELSSVLFSPLASHTLGPLATKGIMRVALACILVGHASSLLVRRSVPLMQTSAGSSSSTDLSKAQDALIAEIGNDSRSLSTISSLLAELEAPGPPPKVKRALVGDWKLAYVSDQDALSPFTATGGAGPFKVLEDVYHRLFSDGTVQSIEVVRKVGPFGNVASSLCGRWGTKDKGGKSKRAKSSGDGEGADSDSEKPGSTSWRTTYMIDERGREVDPPAASLHEAQATHVSDQLLVLRSAANEESVCVFTRLGKGELKKELEEFALLDLDAVLGGRA